MTYPLEVNIPMILSHLQGHSLLQAFRCNFCPRDAMLVRYCLSSRVCLSICLSVTSGSCTKTAAHRITQTVLHNSPGCYGFMIQKIWTKFGWNAPTGPRDVGGVCKYCILRPVEKSPSQAPYCQKFVYICHGGPRPRWCASRRTCGVINI